MEYATASYHVVIRENDTPKDLFHFTGGVTDADKDNKLPLREIEEILLNVPRSSGTSYRPGGGSSTTLRLIQGTDLVKGLAETLPELDRPREQLEPMAADFTAEEEEEAQVVVMSLFHQVGDPTVLVEGTASGWPLDYAEVLMARFRSQIVVGEKNRESVSPQPLELVLDEGLEKVVSNLKRSASFEALSDDDRLHRIQGRQDLARPLELHPAMVPFVYGVGARVYLTPYGTSVRYTEDEPNPSEPVTHGQFLVTEFNIVDKFVQAIHTINPKVQLQINEFARLNAALVKPSGIQNKNGSTRFLWEPVEQWESPTACVEFMSSLVEPPLALINMVWSLEVAVEAY
ncbi:hypothetical protein FBULB1_14297 [Fusarium bulbicola]|nr:hypothetical protein FBULB1_14297 [Fusarium bulbicola]